MENEDYKKKYEDLLRSFLMHDNLIDALGDALMHITLCGQEVNGNWQAPEWRDEVLFTVALARDELKKYHQIAVESRPSEQ